MRSNEQYIVRPFTIDNKTSNTLDDGFSITVDPNDNPSLNIHISLISFEYLKRGYGLNNLLKETNSTKIKRYIGNDIISNYSLQLGERRVLTVRIKNKGNKGQIYYAICENIEIENNFSYNDAIEKEFHHFSHQIFSGLRSEDNHKLVTDLMGCYSYILSRYLYLCGIGYIVNNRVLTGDKTRKGSFTSPLRKRECLINQFIILQHLKDVIEDYFFQELLLFEKEYQNRSERDEKPKTLRR